MENLRRDSFPAAFTTTVTIDSIEYVMLRMPSIKSFPATIDWTVEPAVGYYMFKVVENDMLEIMWNATTIQDPQVVAKRAEIEVKRVAQGLGHRHAIA